jgi:uncharacterized protein (DUF4415 family)
MLNEKRSNIMSRTLVKRTLVLPSAAEQRKILRAAKADPDAQPLSAKQLKALVPLRSLRGRPKLAKPKQLVSVRYSAEVIEYFRGTGEGWQSRMDGVLREYVAKNSLRRSRKAT